MGRAESSGEVVRAQKKSWWLTVIPLMAVLAVLAGAREARANSTGIVGYSGKQVSNRICTQCHGGGMVPDVRIEGPLEVSPGSVSTFRMVVVSSKPSVQKFGGFDVAASAGTLASVEQGTKLLAGELTHSARKAISASTSEVGWNFSWQAPAEPGQYDIFGAGNSVNGDSGQGGDNALGTKITVNVIAAESPTDTPAPPTVTPTAVPPTATETSAPTSTATSAPTSTRRNTPVPTPTRTGTATATPSPTSTPSPQPTGPTRGDGNCDRHIDAADLTAVVRQLALGVIGDCNVADGDCSGTMDAVDVEVTLSRAFGAAPPPACLVLP